MINQGQEQLSSENNQFLVFGSGMNTVRKSPSTLMLNTSSSGVNYYPPNICWGQTIYIHGKGNYYGIE